MPTEKQILKVEDLMERYDVSREHVYEVMIGMRLIEYFRTKINSGPYRFTIKACEAYEKAMTKKSTIYGQN